MAANLVIRPAVAGDALALAEHLRAADAAEVLAATGKAPLPVIQEALAVSTLAWAAEIDGRLACLFGVAPISMLGGQGSPWMLGTPVIDRHPSVLMRASFPYLADMLWAYPHLINLVDARNTRSLRWLRRLGFLVHPPVPYGPAGLPFHPFELRLEDV